MVARRQSRSRRPDLSVLDKDMTRELLDGQPWFNRGRPIEELEEAWRLHHREIQELWARDNPPGTRCFGEWLFEIVPVHGERKITKDGEQLMPYRRNWERRGILHTHLVPAAQEPEHVFLFRVGYIDEAEYRQAEAASKLEA